MNAALYDIIDGEETFVGFCYVHRGRRVVQANADGCQHPVCVNLRNTPDNPKTMFNLRRLRNQNEIGQTTREIEKEIIEKAEEEGREIQRPTF